MIVPPCRGVNYSCGVDTADYIYEGRLGIRRTRELPPSFVIDDLQIFMSACMKDTCSGELLTTEKKRTQVTIDG